MKRLLCLVLAALPASAALPQDKSTLRVAWTPPSSLDPIRAANLNDARVLSALYEGLVTYAADHVTPVAGAAEKCVITGDGLVYSFELRDSKWSDGEPVVAADFVRAWRRALDSSYGTLFEIFKNVRGFQAAREADGDIAQFETLGPAERRAAAKRLADSARRRHISSLQALVKREKDDAIRASLEAAAKNERPDLEEKDLGFVAMGAKSLQCALERPVPGFLDLLGFAPFYPVGLRTEKWPDDPGKIPTNGPYRIESWNRMAATLKRVRGEGPETVVIEWRDPAEALKLFEQGRLDWLDADTIPVQKVAEVAAKKEFQYFDLWATAFLRVNTARGAFAKPSVRRAFALAIDRAAVREAVRCNPSDTLVPSGFSGYPEVKGLGFSATKAFAALLKDYTDVKTFPKVELLVMDAPRDRLAAETLRSLWDKYLGITVKVHVMKPRPYIATLAAGEYEMALGAWAGDVFDPVAFLDLWTKDNPRNLTGWSSEEFEKRLAEARDERDEKKRLAALASAERLLLADAAVVPLYTIGSYYLVNSRVKGVTPNLMGRLLLQHIRL